MDPNELLNNPESIKALISVLQGLLNTTQNTNDTTQDEQKSSVAPSKPASSIKTRGRQKVAGNNIQSKNIQCESTNKFEKMSEFRMHKDDREIDKKLSVVPPVARMRDFEFVDVVCRICGKTESIPPALLHDAPGRYKCNNCSTQSG